MGLYDIERDWPEWLIMISALKRSVTKGNLGSQSLQKR